MADTESPSICGGAIDLDPMSINFELLGESLSPGVRRDRHYRAGKDGAARRR
jgi:hypothetical protein